AGVPPFPTSRVLRTTSHLHDPISDWHGGVVVRVQVAGRTVVDAGPSAQADDIADLPRATRRGRLIAWRIEQCMRRHTTRIITVGENLRRIGFDLLEARGAPISHPDNAEADKRGVPGCERNGPTAAISVQRSKIDRRAIAELKFA